jgi:hypothetical protein
VSEELEAAVRRAGFAALLDGRQPTLGDLARAAGVPDEAAVAGVVAALVARGRATKTPDGRLDGIAGLTGRPTRHSIERAGTEPGGGGVSPGKVHTWCAFDAVAIPAALGWTATAVTTCGSCGADLRVPLEEGVPSGDAWGWLPPGDCEHVLRDFCAAADLFCHRAHLDAWQTAAGDSPGEPQPVAHLADLGRTSWADCLPPTAGSPDRG